MPSFYAHFQFGKEIIRKSPKGIKDIINTNINSIDAFIVGLQGPDPLYFHNPIFYTSLNREAGRIHHSSGLDFFIPSSKYIRENKHPETISYILGCITHYALDSSCHPVIIKHQKEEKISHRKVEREFDDYIMRMNFMKPGEIDLKFPLPLNKNLVIICSPFYKKANPSLMNTSIRDMRNTLGRLNSSSKVVRYFEYTFLSLIPPIKTVRDMIPLEENVYDFPDEYFKRNEEIYSAFKKSIPRSISLMEEMINCIEKGDPLSDEFSPDYLGHF